MNSSSNAAQAAAGRTTRRPPTKGDRRERALLDSMEELLARRPLAEVSVDQVARRAGVSRTAFYFYFGSKEAALRALVERTLASVWRTAGDWFFSDADPQTSLRRGVEGLVGAWIEHAALLTAVADAASYDAQLRAFWRDQLESFIAAVTERIERDAEAGLTRDGLDPRAVAEALCWMNERYCYSYLGSEPPPRTAAEAADSLFWVWRHAIYRG
jgi:TetR/AcrR family transcriptional regulator, ethionamide resistance regulator